MLGATPTDKILDAFTCERVGDEVSETAKACGTPEHYLWIQTGALYTAPTLTNDTAWVCLVKRLKTLPKVSNRIILVTGRHGDAVNWEMEDGSPLFTYDESHTVDDTKKEEQYRGEMLPAQVQVVSVSTLGGPHREKLRSATHDWIKAGHTVIYSWCYSFYSFHYEVGPKSFKDFIAAKVKYSRANELYLQYKNDTKTEWKTIRPLRESSKREAERLGDVVNQLAGPVELLRNQGRATALQDTLKTRAERELIWVVGRLYHPALYRPKMPLRRPPSRKKFG
ncbi:hypothetical protein [Haliangium ochraceum]|uniref:Uncharacterized protein n=1 Tax=Haliangium ochraceum (strain DSM 14365 / JCM 11303 / SMP-2) TaxID=502025 RepID=D0LWZ1_HALO1|nr:hypothetical protein [Haliangium ochraceum]ACY14238.1 hypothetical protein Hoch_1688 [Haliangium ochraceum DSM 14365]